MRHLIRLFVASGTLFTLFLFVPCANAQSSTTGLIAGVVSDASGGLIPGAEITLTNLATSATQHQVTSASGSYRFSFVPPASYTITVKQPGFEVSSRAVDVSIGVGLTADFKLLVARTSTSVDVSGSTPIIDVQDADVSTNFTRRQIEVMPNSGQDITMLGETAPGATTNTSQGKGSFSFYGLGATSNMFTVNGMDQTTMYNNRNGSGATNLTLGVNEILTATVVTNAYSGQYGRLAGSQVDYVTRSGTNAFHGNLLYDWNGRVLNANNFFNKRKGTGRSFDNVNQGAGSASGPIIRNHMFFFVDYTVMRILLPTSAAVNVPSPQFEAATLAHLQTVSPLSVPFYNQVFSVYNNAPGASAAQNILSGGGCGTFTTLGSGVPCALQFEATPSNLTDESQLSWRIDQIVGPNDHAFLRILTDHGSQASSTSPFTPALNVYSNQPHWEGQANETHTFGARSANQFSAAFTYLKSTSQPPSVAAALALSPFAIKFSGSAFTSAGYNQTRYNGRGETFYEIGDDYSYVLNKHSLRTGIVFRRDLMNYNLSSNTAGTATATLSGFYNGNADQSFTQSFPTALEEPSAFYNVGWYGDDDWQATRDLHLTLALRFEHNSNPVCEHDCFARLVTPFGSLTHSASIPYDQAIEANAFKAFYTSSELSVLPRIGFSWAAFGSRNTVVRGGFGLFASGFPGQIIPSFETNTPRDNSFTVTGPISPAASGNVSAQAAANSIALSSGFAQGETLAQIQAVVPKFAPPAVFTAGPDLSATIYREWNIEIQRAIGNNMSASINYVGNNGSGELFENAGFNGYCPTSLCPAGYAGLPSAAPDSRFGTVTELDSNGFSNFNGVTASFTRKMTHGFLVNASYTFGHSLDVVSNGGILGFIGGTDASILLAQKPQNPKANYGNSDYDVRHTLNLNYLWQAKSPLHDKISRAIMGGWTFSGTALYHSAYPFTVIDSTNSGSLSKYNVGGPTFANYLGGAQGACSVNHSCLIASEFSAPSAGFGTQERNQFRGVGFVNTDLQALKTIPAPFITSEANFSVGVQLSNLFNHPNFDLPVADLANAQFGSIISTVSVPTSLLGTTNLGGDASPRLIQLTAKFSF
jgi:hypothetical protein